MIESLYLLYLIILQYVETKTMKEVIIVLLQQTGLSSANFLSDAEITVAGGASPSNFSEGKVCYSWSIDVMDTLLKII